MWESVVVPSMFQSRNRDAFHFKREPGFERSKSQFIDCFNLGIEMLFISRAKRRYHLCYISPYPFMLSSFNLGIEMLFISRMAIATVRFKTASGIRVSISESRCFSFQDICDAAPYPASLFYLSFNLGIEMLFISSDAQPQ